MNKLLKLKLNINKRNNQINLSVPRKSLPPEIKKLISKKTGSVGSFMLRLEGFE